MDVKIGLFWWCVEKLPCVVGSFFRCVASRTASLRLKFGGVWVDVKIAFFESGASLLLRFGGVWALGRRPTAKGIRDAVQKASRSAGESSSKKAPGSSTLSNSAGRVPGAGSAAPERAAASRTRRRASAESSARHGCSTRCTTAPHYLVGWGMGAQEPRLMENPTGSDIAPCTSPWPHYLGPCSPIDR